MQEELEATCDATQKSTCPREEDAATMFTESMAASPTLTPLTFCSLSGTRAKDLSNFVAAPEAAGAGPLARPSPRRKRKPRPIVIRLVSARTGATICPM
jgi:hypothetical protein